MVVGVAVVEHGRVLAARRTTPLSAAGSWELPGGKVEPGESIEGAAVREVAEELDCTVAVRRPLAASSTLAPGLVLRVVLARLVDGEPVPREHDALRWLGPEELREVPWLAADEPFLAELEQVLLDGERFEGGNVGGATRIGLTVRRPTGPWSEAVHALLAHLRARGLDGVPQVLGTDARGREVLTYLPGRGLTGAELPSDALLADAVAWIRRFHDAVADFRPRGAIRWRTTERMLADDEIVCHNDAAGYNWTFVGDRVIGMLDWDMAGPGRPVDDLAFIAWSTLPLHRPLPTPDVVRRLELMARAYGRSHGERALSALAILDAVEPRMRAATDRIEDGQRRGDPGMLNLLLVGEPARTRAWLDEMRSRLPAIRAALARRTAG